MKSEDALERTNYSASTQLAEREERSARSHSCYDITAKQTPPYLQNNIMRNMHETCQRTCLLYFISKLKDASIKDYLFI